MPNQEGGMGVPKYIKEPVEEFHHYQGSYVDVEQKAPVVGAMSVDASNRRNRSDSKELSALAPVFVAK